MKMMYIAILVLLLGAVFADSPPPMEPRLQLNLMQGAVPYAGDVNVTYVCSQNGDEVSLLCNNGTCNNGQAYDYMARTWYPYGDPCFYSNGTLRVQAGNRTFVTKEISLMLPEYYGYDLDMSTGSLNAPKCISNSDCSYGYNCVAGSCERPGPDIIPSGCCGSGFVLLGIAAIGLWSRKRVA